MMRTELKYHPAEELLAGFTEGRLSAGMSVAIAAHIETCTACRETSAELESKAAAAWSHSVDTDTTSPSTGISKSAADDVSGIIASITNQPQSRDTLTQDDVLTETEMLEHSVRLPKVLAKVAAQGLLWKKLAGGIYQASVTLDGETQCDFLYMKPGSKVPVHKHQGTETTLVLDGSFSDDSGKYHPSDFIVRDSSHTHQPASEEGCLCFAVLDSPLTFTSGLARLLNPLLRYRFNRATRIG